MFAAGGVESSMDTDTISHEHDKAKTQNCFTTNVGLDESNSNQWKGLLALPRLDMIVEEKRQIAQRQCPIHEMKHFQLHKREVELKVMDIEYHLRRITNEIMPCLRSQSREHLLLRQMLSEAVHQLKAIPPHLTLMATRSTCTKEYLPYSYVCAENCTCRVCTEHDAACKCAQCAPTTTGGLFGC
jgi:hypothetical protein